jgi:hypothetical protein
MDNLTIKLKIKERLNKLASFDYDNIQNWQIIEAFNKGTVSWCRRQLHGTNLTKTGDEQTKRRIDDLQVLLVNANPTLTKQDKFYDFPVPTDYFEYKRIGIKAASECCKADDFVVYLVEEANIDIYLKDPNKNPNFKWRETFCTLLGNTMKVFTNNNFEVTEVLVTYYKQPRRIEFLGTSDPYTGIVSTVEVISEFKDDIVEVLIDEAVKILAADIENFNTNQLADNQVESNN